MKKEEKEQYVNEFFAMQSTFGELSLVDPESGDPDRDFTAFILNNKNKVFVYHPMTGEGKIISFSKMYEILEKLDETTLWKNGH